MMTTHDVVALFAPWQSLYSKSKVVSTSVTAVHLVGLLLGGGLAVAADRSTLRASVRDAGERRRQLAELHQIHRPVLMALTLSVASGLLLATADLGAFLDSPAFYVKLGLISLLMINGLFLTRTESRLRGVPSPATPLEERLWQRLRTTSYLSLVLWVSTLIAGVVLVNAA